MKRFLLVLLLANCTKWGPPQTEAGHVEDLIFLPAQHGTTVTNKGAIGFTSLEATYGIVFSCEHGKFAVQGNDERHEALWKRFTKGQAVTINYRVSEKGALDFLDATVQK